MIIRHPLTILTLAAIVMASGAVLAGGMPSDEGPEVVLEELGFDGGASLDQESLDDDSLDQDTITAIIKSQMPEDSPMPETLPAAFVPAAYVTAVVAAEAAEAPPLGAPKLPPALTSPEGELPRDHR